MKNIQEGKEASIMFLLKTLGYKRGYKERNKFEIPQNENPPRKIIIEIDEEDANA